jgi:hypothetical protein
VFFSGLRIQPSRFSWTLIVRSTMSSSPTAVSSRWSRFYADGSVIEMATIGREGCTGMQAFFGAKISSVRLLVQIPGSAAKMSRVAFARAMASMPSFRHLMSAYIHAFLEPRHRYAR